MKSWLLALLLLLPSLSMADEAVSVIDVMLARHNAFRRSVGLPPHVLDAGLCRFAQNLADRQAAAGRMFHSGADWPWPECVCYGATDGQHAVTMWIQSGAHNAILRSRTQAVGFGFRNGFAAALFGEPVEQPKEQPTESPSDLPQEATEAAPVCVDGSCGPQAIQTGEVARMRVLAPLRRSFGFCRRGRCG